MVRNFGTLAVGEAVARLLALVALIVLARRLEPGGFGLITLGTTLVVWFGLLVDSGTEVLNVRDIARRPDRLKEIAESMLGLRLTLSIVTVAAFVLAVLIASPDSPDRDTLVAFALLLPVIALNLRWTVLGVGGAMAVAAGNIASQLFILLGVLLAVARKHDVLAVPLLQSGGELLYALIVAGAVALRFGALRPRVDLQAWRITLRASLPLLVHRLARTAVFSFDVLLIAVILGRTETGFYGAAYKPILLLVGGMALWFHAFLASYSAASPEDRRRLFGRTVATSFVTTLLIAIVLSSGSKLIVGTVYGAQYAPAAAALAILVWTVPVLALVGPYANALIAVDRQDVLMRSSLVAAGLNVSAGMVVIPLAGIRGAAMVTVVSELVLLVLVHGGAVRRGLAPSVCELLRGGGRAPVVAERPLVVADLTDPLSPGASERPG